MDGRLIDRRGEGRNVARLAWSLLAVVVLLTVADLLLMTLNGALGWNGSYGITGVSTAVPLTFAAMGALVASRQHNNAVGWIFLAAGLSWALGATAQQYAIRTAFVAPGSLPGAVVAAWLGSWAFLPVLPLLGIFLPLLFPHGTLPSKRWRIFAFVIGVVAVAAIVVDAYPPTNLTIDSGGELQNATLLASGQNGQVANIAGFLQLILAAAALVAIVGMILRYRRATAEVRHQLKWFLFSGAILVAAVITTTFASTSTGSSFSAAFFVVAALGLPVATGVAILKYRLYDIDVVISRTLVYASLAALITAIYVGIAVGIGSLVGSGGKPNLGLSILATGIVAVGFQPVRERLQRIANRLVYGKRATPYEVLSEFSGRVAESYASEAVLPRMARVLCEGTSADLAEVWLRSGAWLRRAAAFPDSADSDAAVEFHGSASPSMPHADRTVFVGHQGDVLGALTVTKRRGESLTPIEMKLMDDLAHQAGLVLKNVGLSADLQARLDDLRVSRQRLVAAQDSERRRIERNLHDGAQQHLVAIKVKLALVEMLAARDKDKAATKLAELKHDADEALETLRDLARGIYPPLLADQGLGAALRSQAAKATVPVHVDCDGVGRYTQETEAALYFCTLEALQNIQKYAAASRVEVRLSADGRDLSIEIVDDGCGFDTQHASRGAGLTNMEDRLDALGGTLLVESAPGAGTTLRATVPIAALTLA
jgi:signal transduction histidine kinase